MKNKPSWKTRRRCSSYHLLALFRFDGMPVWFKEATCSSLPSI
jgi:hypothetical protein